MATEGNRDVTGVPVAFLCSAVRLRGDDDMADVHCWKDQLEHVSETHGFGSDEWAECQLGSGGTCLLEHGHDGPHEFTPDDQFGVSFSEPTSAATEPAAEAG
jgi:hypothetical protein